MARGWESKSVESQQIEERSYDTRSKPDPAEVERARRRDGLEMSRRRVMNELGNARSDVHRAALQAALEHLDRELSNLSS